MTRVAAYGLCFDDARRMLLVRIAPGYTRDADGKWTLPGGGLKFGEEPAVGAVRELEEETGYIGEIERLAFVSSIARLQAVDGLGPYHGLRIVYHMRITGGELRHEREESTDMAAWIALDELHDIQVVELVEKALEYLRTQNVAVAD
ncbi:MAG TPA: NUDIX domain-containing protein [Candidatus Limnocylindrales bacterium]